MTNDYWEREISTLLNELSATQADLLALLEEKRRLLVSRDAAALAEIAPREAAIVARLQACQERRKGLLDHAGEQQLPNDSIRSLTKALPEPARKQMAGQVDQTARRFRLLNHHSLANWVLIQRSLLHLSQLLEIIATGGRKSPTYGRVDAVHKGGSLVDQAA